MACAQPPARWFDQPLLPEAARRSEMYAYVNASIPPLPHFRTLEEWRRYREELKPRVFALLGIDDIVARHKLRVVQKGRLEREGYTIEKINYESYPGMWVPALVWAPKNVRGKAPAAVSISGHLYCDSKAGDYVQARNYNLVRRGFIVISYDYFGCFERNRRDPCAPGAWGGEDHTNSLFSYTRRTPTGIEVLDGMRAVDYLYSRPDVDRTRILFTGESGGGNSTYWVSALDERVTLSVPVSSAGTFEQWIKADLNYDWHQRPPGLRALADIGTLYALVAPRPLLIINGHPELPEFALPDALRSFEHAKAVYRLYGRESAITFHESTTGHGYQPDKRAQLYRWVERWFFQGKMPHGTAELPYQPETRDILRAGLPEGNLTIPSLAERWVKEAIRDIPLPATSESAARWQREARGRLESLLSRRHPSAKPGVICNHGYIVESGEYKAEHLIFEVEPDLLIPGILVRKAAKPKYKTVIFLEKRRGDSEEARALLDHGYALLLLDPRGTGEMDWGNGRTSNWANFLGRPPVGMWAEDISKVTTYLLGRPDVAGVAVLGYGLFGKAALYAAALDTRISAAAVTTDTVSYRREATSGLAHVYADVPHILTWGDTAQLAALVAPRPLAILGAGLPQSLNGERPAYFSPLPRWQPSKERADDSELRSNYEWTRRFYRVLNAEPHFTTGRRQSGTIRWLTGQF